MSYIRNIGRFSGDNLGGLLDISIARLSEVKKFPAIIRGAIYEEIELHTGKIWYKWFPTHGSANFKENENNSQEGVFQKYDLPFDIPKDGLDNSLMFSRMKKDRFIVIFRDKNGNKKVFGHPENPVRFSSELGTGSSSANKNGYSCKFYTEGTSDVLNFYMKDMPATPSTPPSGSGAPVVLKKQNGEIIATLQPGAEVVVTSGFKWGFQIISQ